MSKLKKKAFAVILGGALSAMSCLPVFAAESEISPHVEATRCYQCGTGTIYTHRTEKYEHDERIDGVYYKVYKVTVTSSCDSCNYRDSYSYQDHRRP